MTITMVFFAFAVLGLVLGSVNLLQSQEPSRVYAYNRALHKRGLKLTEQGEKYERIAIIARQHGKPELARDFEVKAHRLQSRGAKLLKKST